MGKKSTNQKADPKKNRAIEAKIRRRLLDLQLDGEQTSAGDPINFSAIGRTANPPVTRNAIYGTVRGVIRCQRLRDAIERELHMKFWG